MISEADTGPALVQVSDIRCFSGQDYWDPNAVVALQRMPGAEAEGSATLSELCQTACLREVRCLEAEYNNGEPFPARAKRKLRTGPPIQ